MAALKERLRNFLMAGVEERITELEAEVQECRQVNLRLAELTDVVAELLVPLSERDTEKVEAALASYRRSVGFSQ